MTGKIEYEEIVGLDFAGIAEVTKVAQDRIAIRGNFRRLVNLPNVLEFQDFTKRLCQLDYILLAVFQLRKILVLVDAHEHGPTLLESYGLRCRLNFVNCRDDERQKGLFQTEGFRTSLLSFNKDVSCIDNKIPLTRSFVCGPRPEDKMSGIAIQIHSADGVPMTTLNFVRLAELL